MLISYAVYYDWDTLLVSFKVHSNWDTMLVFLAVYSNWDTLLNLDKVSLLCKIDYMHVLNEFDSIDMNHPIVRFTTKILRRSVHE